MPTKITKKQFIEAIENNEEGLNDKDLALKIGITPVHFCNLKKKYRDDIRDAANDLVKSLAVEQINNLKRNAKKGDTQAAKYLLEMTKSVQVELLLEKLSKEVEELKQQNDQRKNLKIAKVA